MSKRMGKDFKMENGWKKFKKKQIIKDIMVIMTVIFCFCIGSLLDWQVKHNIIIHNVNNMEELSSTLLSVQSTVGTIILTVISLISGNIAESHIGISLTDYYLNIRPIILKQKVIIFGVLGLIFANVWFHLYGHYNIVYALFAAMGILIIESIRQIYSFFKGKELVCEEIEEYYIYILSKKNNFKQKKVLYNRFVDAWAGCISKQELNEYKKYMNLFCFGMENLLKSDIDDGMSIINEESEKIADSLLMADNEKALARGIEFVQDIYMTIIKLKNDEIVYGLRGKFELFENIIYDFSRAIEKLPLGMVKTIFDWELLSNNIMELCFWLNENVQDENEKQWYALNAVGQFSRNIGYCLTNQIVNEVEKRNSFEYIKRIFKNIDLEHSFGINEKEKNRYLDYKCMVYFDYFYGLIQNDCLIIVKENVYYRLLNNLWNSINWYNAKFFLLIECYLYYLSEEDEECVSPELKKSVEETLLEKNVVNNVNKLLDVIYNSPTVISINMEKELYDVLKKYELFPKYSNIKLMIMERTVEQFWIFIILYIENQYSEPELFRNAFGNNKETIIGYQCSFLGENEKNTKEKFKKLYKMFDHSSKKSDDIDNEINLLYEKFNNYVSEIYKRNKEVEADEKQKEYEATVNPYEITNDISEKVKEHILEKFEPIIENSIDNAGIQRFEILHYGDLTDNIKSSKFSGKYTYIDGQFLNIICKILKERGNVSQIYRSKFKDDNEYISYLQKHEVDTLIGPIYRFKNIDYKNKEKFEEFLEKCNCIYTGYEETVLAMKRDKLKICVHSIDTTIHPMTIDEAETFKDENTGLYMYEISNGVNAKFEEDELKKYLHDERKVISVYVTMSVMSEYDTGILIQK